MTRRLATLYAPPVPDCHDPRRAGNRGRTARYWRRERAAAVAATRAASRPRSIT